MLSKLNFSRNKSIKTQLVIDIGLALLVLMGFCAIFLTAYVKKSFNSLSMKYVNRTASYYSERTRGLLAEEYAVGLSLSSIIQQYESFPNENRRNFINTALRQTLVDNDTILAVYTAWLPNALDGMDEAYASSIYHDSSGVFMPLWTHVGSVIDHSQLRNYHSEAWYVQGLHASRGVFLEPKKQELFGKTLWSYPLAFPLQNSKGDTVGVLGIEMKMETMSTPLQSANVYNSGYITLVSQLGHVAFDPDKEIWGTTFPDFNNPKFHGSFNSAQKSLEPFSYYADGSSSKIYRYFVPFQVAEADEVFFLGLNVNQSEIDHDSIMITAIMVISFLLTIVIISIITYISISRMTKEINKGVAAMKNIAQGDGDLTVRMQVRKQNELGSMYTYFNETMEKLQSSLASVKLETEQMKHIGDTLALNMDTTADSVHEISASISSVNNQVQHQEQSVRQATSSIESIKVSVDDLIQNIQYQSTSVAQSSSAIEQMVANIRSVTKILEKNSSTIHALEDASETGKENLTSSVKSTTEIQAQSETLLQASRVIQHIASQTNLLP